MSFFDDASLAFLPSGAAGKDGKAYSIKPTDGTGDFTFSRGSNLAATRVGADGLIEKGRENLLVRSNEFDTTWVNANTAETSGQSGYNGSSDAWLVTKSAANGMIYQDISASGVQTLSVYAKAGTSTWLRLVANTSAFQGGYFDLSNGVTGGVENAVDTEIEDIGSGWYRCSVILNGSTTRVRIYPAEANSSAATTGSIYIQDAQLEIGLAATDVISTGATTGKAGLLEDEPRFDYSGGATCGSLLLEPSRTQLIPYSEYLGGNSSSGSISFTYNDSTSPEGLDNAALVSVTDGNDRISPSFAAINGLVTISLFLKHSGTDFQTRINTYNNGDASFYGATIDVTASGVTFTSYLSGYTDADFEDYGNGWFRVWVVCQSTTGNTSAQWRPSSNGVAISYPCYGYQCEAGSYPTSYIPNHSGGSVTRGADDAYVTSASSIINSEEGVLFCEVEALNEVLESFFEFKISNGLNQVRIQLPPNSNIQGAVFDGGYQALINHSATRKQNNKIAFKYKVNDFALFINGVKVGSDTSGTTFSANFLNRIDIGNEAKVKQALLFPTALSDADCITLTT